MVEDLRFGTPAKFSQYTTEPERVEAIRLNAGNLEIVARLIGGAVGEGKENPEATGSQDFLRIPAIGTDLRGQIGDYVVKDLYTGRYLVYTQAEFEEKGFKPMTNLREGFIPRNAKTDIVDPYETRGIS